MRTKKLIPPVSEWKYPNVKVGDEFALLGGTVNGARRVLRIDRVERVSGKRFVVSGCDFCRVTGRRIGHLSQFVPATDEHRERLAKEKQEKAEHAKRHAVEAARLEQKKAEWLREKVKAIIAAVSYEDSEWILRSACEDWEYLEQRLMETP